MKTATWRQCQVCAPGTAGRLVHSRCWKRRGKFSRGSEEDRPADALGLDSRPQGLGHAFLLCSAPGLCLGGLRTLTPVLPWVPHQQNPAPSPQGRSIRGPHQDSEGTREPGCRHSRVESGVGSSRLRRLPGRCSECAQVCRRPQTDAGPKHSLC